MRRRYDFNVDEESEENVALNETRKQRSGVHALPFYVGIVFVVLLLGLFFIVATVVEILPTALNIKDEATNPDAFITGRARADLKKLTDLGPRIAGGHVNENLTTQFLEQRLKEIINGAHSKQKIEVDFQVVSGHHYLSYAPHGKIVAYSNLQNIVVKLHSANSSDENSLLVNCHFDSVPTSPGGSDDGINCAAMLEILRLLAKKPNRPLHSIIFLFNGAEETGLQAAHGFITQHKWAKECKVVLNLEAAGAGGKIILFQSGPRTPWLMEYYNKVPHPYGQAAGEEIFQSNIIPSDTDFRIFRDYGGLVGFDMAFFKSGYRYHTKFDGYDNIPLGSYQHVGDNALSLVTNLANAPEMSEPHTYSDGIVYFDVLGLFMVSYTQLTAHIVNYIAIVLSVFLAAYSFHNFKLGYTRATLIFLILTFGAVLAGWVVAGIFVILVAFLLDVVGYPMSWYGNTWIIFGLYAAPAIALSASFLPLIRHKNLSNNIRSQVQAHAVRLIWTFVLLVGTVLGLRAMYFIMIPVMFCNIGFLIIEIAKLQHTLRLWQVVYIASMIFPTMFSMYAALTTLSLFIPIAGRSGSGFNTEAHIGLMTVFFTVLCTCSFVALTTLLRKVRFFMAFLAAVFVLHFIIVFTPLGFPYTGNPISPAPERFWILHTRRVFHGYNGSEIKRDSGYFLLNMDRNSPHKVKPYVEEVNNAVSLESECEKYILCGLPLSHVKMALITKYSTWIPAGDPVIPVPVSFEVLSKDEITPNVFRYNISISGPDRIAVFVSAKAENTIKALSFVDELPPKDNTVIWNGRPVYFILHIYGKSPAPIEFTFDVEVANDSDTASTEIVVNGIHVHPSDNKFVPHYAQFLGKFPVWADVTPWLATYESWWV